MGAQTCPAVVAVAEIATAVAAVDVAVVADEAIAVVAEIAFVVAAAGSGTVDVAVVVQGNWERSQTQWQEEAAGEEALTMERRWQWWLWWSYTQNFRAKSSKIVAPA